MTVGLTVGLTTAKVFHQILVYEGIVQSHENRISGEYILVKSRKPPFLAFVHGQSINNRKELMYMV